MRRLPGHPMIKWLTTLYRQYILKKYPIPNSQWQSVVQKLPLLKKLSPKEISTLKTWVTLFLHAKTFTGVQGLTITDEIRLVISTQACIPILNLDLDYYKGWVEIVVYPGNFIVKRDVYDHIGLVHNEERTLSGESWSYGPVILSWEEVQANSYHPTPGHNVVIHEFSHKLDMLNGRANGMPPLHPSMHREKWTQSLSQSYAELNRNLETAYINRYASTNPAEFFAVISEYFFTAPEILKDQQPETYNQLILFYKLNLLEQNR